MVDGADIGKAAKTIEGIVHETPLLTSRTLNERCGFEVLLKAEHLQRTGSFKIRGAANAVIGAKEDGATFITAASSGNHGQAVAWIARHLEVSCCIVVPEDANEAKVAAIRSYGGAVEYCGTTSAERITEALRLADERGGVYIPPYDHPAVIAGQGTVGLEILAQVPDAAVIVVPVGGGGLLGGILTAVKSIRPDVRIIGVEPDTADDTRQSLENGRITAIAGTRTIADGLRTSQPGDLTFPILQKWLDELVTVSEEEIGAAVEFLMERMKQVVEPSGAASLAAVLAGKTGGGKTVAVLSGGNMDLRQLSSFLPG